MQQEQVSGFFIRIVLVMVVVMALASVAIPEIISMIDEHFIEVYQTGYTDIDSSVTEVLDNDSAGTPVRFSPLESPGPRYSYREVPPVLPFNLQAVGRYSLNFLHHFGFNVGSLILLSVL